MYHKSDLKELPFLTVLKITGHNKGNQLYCIKADVLKKVLLANLDISHS
jgi:hypothetical protein